MNPRDEKILTLIHKKQNPDYENYVPFCVIQRSLPWVDGSELTDDLFKLAEQGYLCFKNFPTEYSGFWYLLTPQGNRECELIYYNNTEKRKNRNIQIVSSLIGVIAGFLLGKFF